MSAPLFLGAGDLPVLGSALLIGVVFGVFLEWAGFGNASKLSGQFRLTDLTVFKVLFTAVVTAMLGAFWLGRIGMLDLQRVYVPGTWLLPQLAGGVVFGAGFALAGLCPGTSCVASASGRVDGLAVVAGMLLGTAVFDISYHAVQPFYDSTPRGTLTLPDLLQVPTGVVVAVLTVLAIAGFAAAEAIERRVGEESVRADPVQRHGGEGERRSRAPRPARAGS